MLTPIQSSNQSESVKSLRQAKVREIWVAISKKLGTRWTKDFNGDAMDMAIWEAAIKGLTVKQIDAGILKLLKTDLSNVWEVGEYEFRNKYCLGIDEHDINDLFNQVSNWRNLSSDQKSGEARFIIQHIDYPALKIASTVVAKRIFMVGYRKLVDHLSSGGTIESMEVKEIENKTPREKRVGPLKLEGTAQEFLKEGRKRLSRRARG